MSTAAVENIGPRERMKRYAIGLLLLVATVGVSIWLVLHEPNRLLRGAMVFPPYWFAWLCLFQASARTCVMHVARGSCNLDQGTTSVDDPALRGKLWAKAVSIYLKTTFTAAIWTACVMMVGVWS